MEIILRENKEITNSALSENLTIVFSKAEDNIKEVAHALGSIMLDGLYTDDFATVKDFANYLSCSTAKLTQFGRFEKIMRMGICTDMFEVMSMTQIIECARLIEFLSDMRLDNTNIETEIKKFITPTMTCKEIREEVNELLKTSEVDAEAEAEAEEAEETAEVEAVAEVDEDATEKESLVNYLSELEEGLSLTRKICG